MQEVVKATKREKPNIPVISRNCDMKAPVFYGN